MRGSPRKSAEPLAAFDCITEQSRERFTLEADDIIMLTDVACLALGSTPLETAVIVWCANGVRHSRPEEVRRLLEKHS